MAASLSTLNPRLFKQIMPVLKRISTVGTAADTGIEFDKTKIAPSFSARRDTNNSPRSRQKKLAQNFARANGLLLLRAYTTTGHWLIPE
ncbi:MAG: hypothetical protein OXG60_01420 [Chloroflexi bacterium]|nr:hypothetical protein [Chloroflexota bacterium]